MTTLSANAARAYQLGDDVSLPVVGTDVIFEGAAVGDNGSGYARPLQAGDPFKGFALRKVDNSTGSAGDRRVEVRKRGRISLAVTGVTGVGDVGSKVYASDDDTFTLSSTSNSLIGVVAQHSASTTVLVEFDADSVLLNA
jgi:hypothetical protein